MDHRMRRVDDMDLRYGLRHAMSFTAGGRFAKIAGAPEIHVNSLHGPGVDRPAPGLEDQGHAPDGTPDAVSVTGARRPIGHASGRERVCPYVYLSGSAVELKTTNAKHPP